MSINPLVAISAAQTAVRAASKLVSQLDFGEILARGNDAGSVNESTNVDGESATSHETPLRQLTERIRSELDHSGISREPPIVLELSSDGQLTPDFGHPQAAAILDQLTQNSEISRLAEQASLPSLPLRLVV